MSESKRWRVEPGEGIVLLDAVDTRSTDGAPGGKSETKEASAALREELVELQRRLYAESEQSLLVVLQARDAGGKDGTVRSVFAGVNPQGVAVTSFKAPTPLELSHDFLWRVHPHAPAKGEIAIFNRSHYEDVLAVRVHELVPEHVWRARYAQITSFEEVLASAGTRVVKLFLHVSPEEQAERLRARIDLPEKHWKWNEADLSERARWDDYQAAYHDMLGRTSTDEAPWHVIPADRKWYRDWAVLNVIVEAMRDMDPQYPHVAVDATDAEVDDAL